MAWKILKKISGVRKDIIGRSGEGLQKFYHKVCEESE